jgi:hypothetical protein
LKAYFSILSKASIKIGLSLLLVGTAFVAFATLGDGRMKKIKPKKSLLSSKPVLTNPGTFSLKSGYSFRGNQVINNTPEVKYINLNTVVTVQQGHTTYILPVKKKVSLNLSSQNQVKGATVNIQF